MNEGRISVRYAQALYALAEEKGVQQEVYQMLERLSQAFIEVPGLARSLANPIHTAEQKLGLLLTATGCAADSLLAGFFNFVISKGREDFMVFISMSYQTLYRKNQRIVVGRITSALPLASGSVEKIREVVDKQFSAGIELSTEVDPEILGGFILEVDNYRMDSSIRSALEQVKAGLLRD